MGTATALLFPSELPHQFFVVFVISGITAGAVTSLAPDWKSALLFVVPPLLALIARLLVNSGEISVVMSIMTLAYLAFISLSAVRAYDDARESATLREQVVANARRLIEAQRIARVGDWEVDAATGRMTWSDTVYEIFGRDPARFRPDMEKYYGELVHPDDVAAVRSEEQAAYASGRVHRIDHRAVMPDGSERSVHLEGIAEFDRDGRPLKIRGTVQDITERKRMEEELRRFNVDLERLVDERTRELRRSEEQLRLFIEQAPAAIAMLDAQMRYVAASQRWLADYSLVEKDLRGRSHYEIFPEIPEHWKQVHRRCLAGAVERCDEDLFVRADGSKQWICWEIRPWYAASDNVGGIVVYSEDITDRKRTEMERSELLGVLESSLNEIYLFDAASLTFRYVNAGALRNLGYTAERMKTLTPLDLKPEFNETSFRAMIAPLLKRQQEKLIFYTYHRRADGSSYPVEVHLQLAQHQGRQVFFAVVVDIAERKESERKLQESQSRLAGIVSSAMDAIVTVDANQNIVLFNDAAERTFGYPASEVVGQPLDRLIPARLRAAHNQHVAVFGRTSVTTRAMGELGTVYGLRANGEEFPIEASISQVEIAGVKSFTAILRDITARNRAEAKLLELNEDLIRSNRELEQFAYVASHDLQEPLRMVSSYTQLLARRYSDKLGREAGDYIHFAVDGANRMQHLIQDLLSYSRGATSGKQIAAAVDLRGALREAVVNLEAAIVESAAVVTDADLPALAADHTQMVQLFQNLIGNAIKFRKDGEPPRVQISAEKSGHEWIISVKDNGIGIDPQYFSRIFAIFQRLHGKDEYSGTGIGLALCQRIVQRHGGKIWVESEPGKGATFRFTIQGD